MALDRHGFTAAFAAMALGLGMVACDRSPSSDLVAPRIEKGKGGGGSSGGSIAFSGDATAVQATVLGTSTTLSHAGPLPGPGGAEEAALLQASIPGTLTAQVLHAATIGQGDRSRSEASTVNLNLTAGGNTIAAGFLMARAEAVCAGSDARASGSSEIVGLTLNGQSISVSGQPNQTILLPAGAGKIVLNEQTSAPGSITVTALHIVVTGVAEVGVSSAHADIVCRGPAQCDATRDFVTGGGWISLPSGAKGTFGVAGGIKNGLWGHLTYIDHGAGGPHVKGTGVTAYVVVDDTTRRVEGTAEVDGRAGFTYAVVVSDHGEPGRDDTFSLQLSNGYQASGSLAGGNIQLHRPCR